MFGKTGNSIPLIFLITDGTLEDERDICNMIKRSIVNVGVNSPRICTFGIGQVLKLLVNIFCKYVTSGPSYKIISSILPTKSSQLCFSLPGCRIPGRSSILDC